MASMTRVLLGLLVFTLPLDQAFAVPFLGSLSRVIGLLTAFVGVLAVFSTGTVKIRRPNLLLIVGALYVAWATLSTLWAIDRASTVGQAFTYVQLWVLIWLLWQFIVTPAQATWLRQAYMLGTWVTIGTVVWAFLSHNPTIDPTRFSALDTNANYTAQSIALAIPMAFDAVANGRGWARRFAFLLIPASIFGIALTGSRSGGIIAVVAILASIALILRARPLVKSMLLTTLALGVVVLGLTLPPETVQRFTGVIDQVETADFSGRGEIWLAGFESWLDRPAIGAGVGNFNSAIVPTLGFGRAAHNSFLALLVELGPIGPLLFLGLFVIAFIPNGVVLYRRFAGADPNARRYAALHVVLLLSILMSQLATNWQYQRVTWFLLIAATFETALYLRPTRAVAVAEAVHGA